MTSKRISLVFIVCLAIIHNVEPQVSAGDMCSMVADPHLTPFASPPGSTVTPPQQWCTQPGGQVLLQNQFVQISIDVASPPGMFYPIDDFTFTFAPSVGAACVINSACLLAGSCCAIPGVTITGSAPSWTVIYTTMLIVNINQWGGGGGPPPLVFYDLNIWQDASQRQFSSGLCVCGCPAGFINSGGGGKGKRDVSRDKRQASSCQAAVSQWMQQPPPRSPSQQGQSNAISSCTQDASANNGQLTYMNAAVSDTLMVDVMRQANPTFSQAQYAFANGGRMPQN